MQNAKNTKSSDFEPSAAGIRFRRVEKVNDFSEIPALTIKKVFKI